MVDDAVLEDRFVGCLLGVAVGDALGAAGEFRTPEWIAEEYGVLADYHASGTFAAGEFTDDTDMTLCVARAILDGGAAGLASGVDLPVLMEYFVEWWSRPPKDIGTLTRVALGEYYDGNLFDQTLDPRAAGRRAWERSGKKSAGNGGVMRTAPVGLAWYVDEPRCRREAERVCQTTHFDPRCVASCVAVSVAIGRLVRDTFDVDALVEDLRRWYVAAEQVAGIAEVAGGCLTLANTPATGWDRGYTVKSTNLAFACLVEDAPFEESMVRLVSMGGDADTNGAIAGGLLGARDGAAAIPDRWIAGLQQRDKVEELGHALWQLVREPR